MGGVEISIRLTDFIGNTFQWFSYVHAESVIKPETLRSARRNNRPYKKIQELVEVEEEMFQGGDGGIIPSSPGGDFRRKET